MKKKLEKQILTIEDDFDLEKIAACGQCFRVRTFDDGTYRFITGQHIAYLRQLEGHRFAICCDTASWECIWTEYFDLSRDYRSLRAGAAAKNSFVDKSMTAGAGIRVLRQNAWEMLITFIISQRKNIPAIAKAVEHLSAKYGNAIETDYETVHTFPTPEELSRASAEELNACGLGYRTAYVMDAIEQVMAGTLDLTTLATYSDDDLFAALQTVHGVGKKVANCVCLFGYGRTARVPVDVWISRAILEECQGHDPFDGFGEMAGIIQQYIFYYKRTLSK